MKFFSSIVIFFLTAAVSLTAAEADTANIQTDSVLASVNGEPVSLSDILFETQNEEYYFANSLDKTQASKAIYELRKKTLEELIDRKLILNEYRKKPFPIDNQSISAVLDDMAVKANCRTRSEFYAKLRESGLSVDEFKRRVEERITVQYMVGRELYINVHISPKAVFEYYREHEDEFATPEELRMNILFLNRANPEFDSRRKIVTEKLRANPSDFYSLLKEYSELPGGRQSDYAVLVSRDKMRTEFKKVINEKNINQLIGPLEISDEGVYYLLVDKVVPGNKKTLDEVRQEIIKKLEEKEREAQYRKYVNKLRSKAIIRYMF